jgi:hypothetical protein
MKLYKSPYNKIVKSKKYGYLLFAGNTGTIKSIRLMDVFRLKNPNSFLDVILNFSKIAFIWLFTVSVLIKSFSEICALV